MTGNYERGQQPPADSQAGRDKSEVSHIPKLREGSFLPSLIERRRRIDRALFAVVMEAWVHGLPSRKGDDLVKALGATSGISKSEVSRICAELEGDLEAFRTRKLDGEFPYVFAPVRPAVAFRVGPRVSAPSPPVSGIALWRSPGSGS